MHWSHPPPSRHLLLAQAVQQHGIDVLIHHAWFDTELLWDVLACRIAGAAVVLYEYGVFSHFLDVTDSSFIPWKDGRIFALVPAIVSLCDAVMSENHVSRDFFGQFNPRAFTARHALDDAYFKHGEGDSPQRQNTDTLLWVGRFDPFKHPEEAIRIFAKVKPSHPGCRLVLVGASYDGTHEPQLQQLAADLGVADGVEFAGFVDPLAHYDRARMVLSTTEIEGFCLVLAEACARGVPVVAYDLPYLQMADCPGIAWAPQGDADEAARQVCALLDDDARWRQMSSSGAAFVAQHYQGDAAACWHEVFAALEAPAPAWPAGLGQQPIWRTLFEHYLKGQERTRLRNEQLQQQAADAVSQLVAAEQSALDAQAALHQCRSEYEASVSYRLGRALLAAPRALRNLLQR